MAHPKWHNSLMPTVTELTVNGTRRPIDADPDIPLLTVLRDHLDLTGTKYGCGEGQCGACTVLLDGQPVRSCKLPVRAAAPPTPPPPRRPALDPPMHGTPSRCGTAPRILAAIQKAAQHA